jgi:pilus assembly protein CpaF
MTGRLDPDLVDRVRRRLVAAGGAPTARAGRRGRAGGGSGLGERDLTALLRQLDDEVAGAGPLGPLLRDPSVTDVLVNAADDVWVERGGGCSGWTCGSATTPPYERRSSG